MTIISRSHGFIFVHVPKTAGTAVTHHLRLYARHGDLYVLERRDVSAIGPHPAEKLNKHSTSLELIAMLGPDDFTRYFTFSVVRNPFDRAVSTFLFLKYKFRKWPKSDIMNEFHSPDDFVTSAFFRASGPGGIFRPQADWLADRNDKMLVDCICKFESLEADLAEIRKRLSLEDCRRRIQPKNVSISLSDAGHAGLTSDSAIHAVRNRYERDFKLLGYPTNPDKPFGST